MTMNPRIAAVTGLAALTLLGLGGCHSGKDSAAKASASAAIHAEMNSPAGKKAQKIVTSCSESSHTVKSFEHCVAPNGMTPALKKCVLDGAFHALRSKSYRQTWEHVTVPGCLVKFR